MEWLYDNYGTVLVVALIIGAVLLVIDAFVNAEEFDEDEHLGL